MLGLVDPTQVNNVDILADSPVCLAINTDAFIMVIKDREGVVVDLILVDCDLVCVAEDCCNLFQWKTLRVGEEEPHDESSDCAGNDEYQVEFPADSDERDRGGLQEDDVHQSVCRTTETDALCAQMCRK